MAKESDRLDADIACIDAQRTPASLISTAGAHCEVWRSAGWVVRRGERTPVDFVIKRYREPCSMPEVGTLARHYRQLKSTLADIIPNALFVATKVDGAPSVCVLAESVNVWFNIANPQNREEAIPLLRTLPKARRQLDCFIHQAKRWLNADDARIIDLYGLDNLVLDIDRNVRYLDSFHVFFFPEMTHMFGDLDDDLEGRIDISLQRLSYLENLLAQSSD